MKDRQRNGARPGHPPLVESAAADFIAWRQGDGAALDHLVRLLTPMLWHTVRAYRLDSASAEDVVQATWLALVRNAERVKDPQAVVRWLSVTARREAWRTAAQVRRVEPQEIDQLDGSSASIESAETKAMREQRDSALWSAVAALSERCQRLLRVVAFNDRPNYEALSEQLQMPVGSIGPTRGRCLAKLRAALGGSWDWRTA